LSLIRLSSPRLFKMKGEGRKRAPRGSNLESGGHKADLEIGLLHYIHATTMGCRHFS